MVYCLIISRDFSGFVSPHRNISNAAKSLSGQVWTLMCDSARIAIPVIPCPSPKRWVSICNTEAPAEVAAFYRIFLISNSLSKYIPLPHTSIK